MTQCFMLCTSPLKNRIQFIMKLNPKNKIDYNQKIHQLANKYRKLEKTELLGINFFHNYNIFISFKNI